MIKKAALFGLLLGAVYLLWLWAVVASGLSAKNSTSILPLFLNLTILAVPLYLGLLSIRKTVYENSINYAQSFYAGIIITVCAALFLFIVLFIFERIEFLVPELLKDMQTVARLNMSLEKLPEAQIAAYVNEELTQPNIIPIGSALKLMIVSGLLTTILALLVRNKDTFTENKDSA